MESDVTEWQPDWGKPPTILIVTADDAESRRLRAHLAELKLEVIWVASRDAALNALDTHQVDALITRLTAPRIQGMAVLELARRRNPDLGAILLIDPGEEERATAAMRRGVVDFQSPPLNVEKIARVLERVIERQRLAGELSRLNQKLESKFAFPNLIGHSGYAARLRARLKELAPLETHVLIVGEDGTGKDLVAAIIHQASPRRNAPFVRLDCAALPARQLLEVLFGRPARGARARQAGRLEIASRGTLYLDGITALPLDVQGRLADVLRTGQMRPIIDAQPVEIRPRIIASAEVDPDGSVDAGRFDPGLFEMIATARLNLVPLRHRRQDIPILARHFLAAAAAERDKELALGQEAFDSLIDHDWPENVRGLKNALTDLADQLPSGSVISIDQLPAEIRESRVHEGLVRISLGAPLAEAERHMITATLRLCRGNREKTAAVLGIGVRTLYRKLRELDEGLGQ